MPGYVVPRPDPAAADAYLNGFLAVPPLEAAFPVLHVFHQITSFHMSPVNGSITHAYTLCQEFFLQEFKKVGVPATPPFPSHILAALAVGGRGGRDW